MVCLQRCKLPSWADRGTPTPTQEDAERLISLLTVPSMSIPLVADFFTVARVACLFNSELRSLLWNVLFQPGQWQPQSRLNSAEADITTVPLRSADRWRLGTSRGVLIHELCYAPHATLMPLLDLFEHACSLCIGSVDSAVVSVLLFVVQVTHRLQHFCQYLLVADAASPVAPTPAARLVLENLTTTRVKDVLEKHALPRLRVRHVRVGVHEALELMHSRNAGMGEGCGPAGKAAAGSANPCAHGTVLGEQRHVVDNGGCCGVCVQRCVREHVARLWQLRNRRFD